MIRVGLAGYGLGGSAFHAPLIRACEGLELSGILTSRDVAGRVDSLDALIAGCDLIVVATPNATHFPFAKAALEAGRHVVIEKPFTATVEEADALMALADRQQRLLTVFHNRRWDSDFLTLRDMLPRLGAVQLFEANWDRFRVEIRDSWKEAPDGSTGLLADLGSHMIDQVLQLFGPPDALQADMAKQRPGVRVDDYFQLTLFYGDMRAVLSGSTLVASARPRFAVHGMGGSFIKHGLDPQEGQLKGGLIPGSPDYGLDPSPGRFVTPSGTTELLPSGRGNYLAFYQGVAQAIVSGAPPPVLPNEARDVMRIIELAKRSADIGERLKLPI
ncbi:Gfo/Idh/MocA family oxidoreductase [Sphingomonas piscis]|uniref:Gfo/Idh/MocA family oxidoreductase n=1 Tax=Sphingomonas piscis TaxID=2714943 RepID=A0A6G7YN74_9SPHN|nr:Gfo/Idh/MocA family oxidoreductase [Sphingomonas piscis]QIK78189.1 Gfo/Idh/MocA family oxidoreductase [Sphingomonas piscis]